MRIHIILLLLYLCTPAIIWADNTLPDAVSDQTSAALSIVGSGTYKKLGFLIYHATLWAPNGKFDKSKPYALQISYDRSLSKSTIVDSTTDSIREEGVDDRKLAEWRKKLEAVLPEVNDGDELVGLALPGKDSRLFLNGELIARLRDPELSNAFFAIWLGKTADKSLHSALLGKK